MPAVNPNAPTFQTNTTAQNKYGGIGDIEQAQANAAWQQQNGARNSQEDSLSLMRQAALGNAPSAAAAQQQQGLDSAIKSQQAMAASARGPGGLASAQYNAAANTGALQQGAVNQAAQLRAQEMAQARGAYGDAASGIRSQDIQGAMGQTQQALAYQGLGQNVGMANLQATGQQNQLDEQHWEKQSDLDAASNAATMGAITGTIGAAAGAASMFSDENIKENISPLQGPQPGDDLNALPKTKPEASKLKQGLAGFSNQMLNMSKAEQAPHQTAAFQPYQPMNLPPMFHPGMDMQSDERVKSGLNPMHAEPAEMMDHLEPKSYNYKPGLGLPPGRKYGIMAQDLEQTPMGASVVHDTPRGKVIDAAQATGVHFAAEANLHERLRVLEAKMGGR